MKKRVIAMLLVLAMAIGLSAQMVTAATPATYDVGYAKVDINPYAELASKSIEDFETFVPTNGADLLALPIGGGTATFKKVGEDLWTVEESSVNGKIDDNGDGKVDANDGLFATCIAVTDEKGNTVLMYGVDLLAAFDVIAPDVRMALLEEFADEGISADRIIINGSHTHTGPGMNLNYESIYETKFEFTPDYLAYKEWLIFQLIKAARVALADRAAATMYKGTIDASESEAAKNDIGDTLNTLRTSDKVTVLKANRYGADHKVYNFVRHYKLTAVETDNTESPYSPKAGGKTLTYYAGNNFNGDWKTGTAEKSYFAIDITNADGTTTKYMITGSEPVSETDDKMHILEFRFENEEKDPIALVNFRGHLPNLSSLKVMSSSSVNSLRYVLEENGYRASFMQGAAGNINSTTKEPEGLWMSYPTLEAVDENNSAAKNDTTHDNEKHNIHGTELAELALELLKDNEKMVQVNTDGGEIRSVQQTYQSTRKRISKVEYDAALEYIRRVDAKELGITDAMLYTDSTTGEQCAISSYFHASSIKNSYAKNGTAGEIVDLGAIIIGDGFALVSAAGELFDRYSKTGNLEENMWDDLVNEETYGTPFVAGYTGNDGYFGSYASFDLNREQVEEDGNISLAVGTYETLTNSYAQGIGEALIDQMDIMLDFLENSKTAAKEDACAHCDETVTWNAITQGGIDVSSVVQAGHYYLAEDITVPAGSVAPSSDACIDLNGYTMTVKNGFTVSSNASLSIVDSSAQNTGCVTGMEAPQEGGVFSVGATGTLNLYSGTINYEGEPNAGQYANGGILCVEGHFNMYGGRVEGTDVNWAGGAIFVKNTSPTSAGVARISGGIITAGTAGALSSHCIANCGTVILSGNPTIASIKSWGSPDPDQRAVATGDMLTFDGKFTGSVNIGGSEFTVGNDVGNAINSADLTKADIQINDSYTNNLHVENGDIVVRARTNYAAKNTDGTTTYGDALTAFEAGAKPVLQKDVSADDSVTENLTLDLNGKTIDGAVTVAEGKTLQVTDSKTADFDTSDGIYGKIKIAGSSSDRIVGAEAAKETETTPETDVYLKIEKDGYMSFHAIDLNINAMPWKPESQGLYYKHTFKGDKEVREMVASYGVALSKVGAPTEEALLPTANETSMVIIDGAVAYTRFTGEFGTGSATSTLVTGIMKETNGYMTNQRNAAQLLYGRAYVRLTDGTILMGLTRERSLQQQVEGFDADWEKLDQKARNSLLRAYKNTSYNWVMKGWNLPNLKENPTLTEEEQDILRILAIGNSHTVDATSMLAAVFAAEMPEQKIMIGNMYRSGCSVGRHVTNAKLNKVDYTYYENENGEWSPSISITDNVSTLADGLLDQCWDVVVLHEMNTDAVMEALTYKKNYSNLQKHIAYVKANSLTTPKLLWNLSWANPTDADYLAQGDGVYSKWSSDYQTYSNGDYTTMLKNMMTNTDKYVINNESLNGEISGMAPTGTAIYYARNKLNLTDKDLYRDYTHMSDLGRLISAYVWYATITEQERIDDVNVDYIPAALCEQNTKAGFEVTQDMKEIIKEAVNYALQNPYGDLISAG